MSRRISTVFTLLLAAAAAVLVAPTGLAQSASSEKIVLPLDLVAGQPATVAVLASDGHVQADVKLNLSNGETLTTDESGRAHFLAPVGPEILLAQIQNTKIFAAADVRRRDDADDLRIQSAPRLASLDGLLRIRGNGFAGDADRNPLKLNGEPVLVLAASPAELVILPPATFEPGVAKFDLRAGGRIASAQITLIRVTANPQQIPPRRTKKITLRVFGTAEPVSLDLHNIRPDVVQFPHRGQIRLKTRGGPDNSVQVRAKGLRPGEFTFTVRLAGEMQPPDLASARDFLEAAYKLAPPADLSRLAKLLKNLEGGKPNLAVARKGFAKLSRGSPGEYEALVRAAREALFGEQ
jgi:hypothetical protein